MKLSQVKITLPNDIDYLNIAIHAVSEMGRLMGFKTNDILKLELGTEEAVSNVIEHAFNESEDATFDVILDPQPMGLKVIIKEMGVPFDPAQIHEYHPETLEQDLSVRGLGTYLMKQFLDEVSFHNLGKQGKETHLFKHLHGRPIHQLINKGHLEKVEKEKEAKRLPKDSVHFTIRRMKPEEAIDVSICAYSSYGYTYVHEDMYYPDRVRELNKTNDLISFVAVIEDGEIIAHGALESEEDKKVWQMGAAFTKPRYRGQGCLNHLALARLQEAKKREFTGVFARCITTHPFSQKSSLKRGLCETAIHVSFGISRIYKNIEQKKVQRESVAILFKYIFPPKELVIFPPEHHKVMIADIYSALGLSPEIRSGNKNQEPDLDESIIDVKANHLSLAGHIIVRAFGKNIVPEVHKSLKGLCYDRIETIYLHLKLTDPLTATYTSPLEDLGFFFSGVIPGSEGRDELIFQYLNNHVIDYDQLKLASEFGQKLLEYIKERDPNVGR